MTIIIFGSNGQLGRSLGVLSEKRGIRLTGVSRENTDITDGEAVERTMSRLNPSLVINAAAYTNVDDAEGDPDTAFNVNGTAPGILARACRAYHIPLIHISTDFVFDGLKTTPYVESDPVNPLGVYGESKAAGEKVIRDCLDRHIIIRTSWLYGIYGANFVKTILKLEREKKELRVVSDQVGCPTSSQDLARAILDLAEILLKGQDSAWGTYHYCGDKTASWYEFAVEIVKTAAKYHGFPTPVITPVNTEAFPTPATRPQYSVLNCGRINEVFGIKTIPWEKSLAPVVRQLSGGL